MCPVAGCTSTFECEADLDAHIAANLHKIPPERPQTTNDIARNHLVETLRSTNVQLQHDHNTMRTTQATSDVDLSTSLHYEQFSSPGWALRTRRITNPIHDDVKSFIEQIWTESKKARTKLTPERIHIEIRSKRDPNTDEKRFQPNQYPTVNQIRYQIRKLAKEHGVTVQDELIHELMEDNLDKNEA